MLAAERQQLAREGSGAFGSLADLVDIVALGIVRAEIFEQQGAVAGDHGQQIVEIMGDPAGQTAHRLHFLRLAQTLLGAPQRFFRPLALDADRQAARDRCQGLRHELRKGVARKHRHDAQDPLLHHQGVAGERHHSLAPRPLLVAKLRIAQHLVGQIRTELLGDQADRAVWPVDRRGHAGAGLELEGPGGFVANPNAGERHVEVAHQGLCAQLQRLAQGLSSRQGAPHVGGQLRQAGPLEQRRLRPAALAAHLGVTQLPLDGRDQPPEIALGEEILRARLHRLDRDVLADRARDEDEGRIGIARAQQGEGRRPAECRHAVVADHEIPRMTIQCGRHGGRGVNPLVCRLVARLLQLPQQQSGVVFGVFRDQHPQRHAHRQAPWWRIGFM